MNTNHTDITVVLDRSGSMSNVTDDTIGGVNRFIDDQKKLPGTASLSLYLFNGTVTPMYLGRDIKEAQHLTENSYVPLGNTALLDAIGQAIADTGKRLSATPEAQRAGRVVFVIVTDGDENSSRSFSHNTVMEMIKHQKEKYSWEFVFLGANQDAIKAGESYGIGAANSMTYAHNPDGTAKAFASVSENLAAYRSNVSASMCFSEEDRSKQLDAELKNFGHD